MRYYIDINRDDDLVDDLEGGEFADLAAAREEAIQSLRDVVAERLRQGGFIGGNWASRLRGEDGTVVFEIRAEELFVDSPDGDPSAD